MRAGLILGTTPPSYIKRGVGQMVGYLRFASAPDDTTLADKSDRKLDGWFFSAAPFFLFFKIVFGNVHVLASRV